VDAARMAGLSNDLAKKSENWVDKAEQINYMFCFAVRAQNRGIFFLAICLLLMYKSPPVLA
jgi:hypothetical protein